MPRESIRILPYFAIPKKGKKEKKKEEIEEAKCETAEPEEYESGREREREERGQTFATSGGWVKMTRVKEKEGRKTVVALIGHHATIFYRSALLSSSRVH